MRLLIEHNWTLALSLRTSMKLHQTKWVLWLCTAFKPLLRATGGLVKCRTNFLPGLPNGSDTGVPSGLRDITKGPKTWKKRPLVKSPLSLRTRGGLPQDAARYLPTKRPRVNRKKIHCTDFPVFLWHLWCEF